MAEKDSIEIGTERDRAHYAKLAAEDRAVAAQEMVNEVIDHYDHARTLVSAVVTELRNLGCEEPAALHLAEVAEAWFNDPDHVAQQRRMFACLQAMVAAHYETGVAHA